MSSRTHNPFQTFDISVPVEFHGDFDRYSQSGGRTSIDQSPFPRMIDLWFLSVCVATRQGLEPKSIGDGKTTKIIDGAIFSSDPWRIHVLMLIAIGVTDDVQIVAEPRRMMKIVNELAIAGLPEVLEMLKDGKEEPIWNLSDALDDLLS